MNPLLPRFAVLVSLLFLIGCTGSQTRLGKPGKVSQTVVRQDNGEVFVRITTMPLDTVEEIHHRPGHEGISTRVIRVDGHALWWEFDRNQDGKVDEVRLELRGGGWVTMIDTNYDGSFDEVRGTAKISEGATPAK
ncbi:MAG: hypothetical protein EXS18_00805 [Verrucomicrobiae bacterium]|nr:hypothetical protein [Verrucomicrobiae bacterium]